MRFVAAITLAVLAFLPVAARAQERVATRPGLMCSSAEALAKLTLPNGSSRAALPRPRPEDLRIKTEGGCLDLHPGSRVTVVEAYHLTSKVTSDPGDGGGARVFIVPNIDFDPVPGQDSSAAPPQPTVLATSARLGVTITADGLNWCTRVPHLRIGAQDGTTLDSAELRTLLQQFAQAVVARRCPTAESVQYSGRVGNGPSQWQATASAADGWAVASADASASPAAGLNLDDLGQVPGPAPVPSAQRSASAAPTMPAPLNLAPPPPPAPGPVRTAASAAVIATPAPFVIGACPIAYPGSPERALPLVCTCDSAAVDSGAVFGTDNYSFDSPPCRAARHAGVLSQDGGTAAFIPVPGTRNLAGSDRNGVDSGSVNNAPASIVVRPALPKLVAYIRDVTIRQSDPALKYAVSTPDGRMLMADPVPPPAFPDATTAAPAPGVAVELPDADAVALPVPPAPLAGGLPDVPWLEQQQPLGTTSVPHIPSLPTHE